MTTLTKVKNKILNARCRLITVDPWYGTMASYFVWKEDENIPTLGVVMKVRGIVECRYNPKFIESLSLGSTIGAIKHELEHVVLLHLVRIGSRDPRLWNIATDMIINGKRKSAHIEQLLQVEEDTGVKLIWYPEDWPENLTSEEVYERLEQNKVIIKLASGQSEVINDGGGDETIVVEGETVDDHDAWKESEIGEDEARQTVKDLVEQSTAQAGAGSVPGRLLEAIKKLEEPIRNWKHDLRQYVGRKFGGRRKTYARQNRRRQTFGTPGHSSHASAALTLCLDTSGSMDTARLEQFMSEIESMSQRFKITLVQFDHGYQCHDRYHRGDWRDIEISGRGGTSFIALFEALNEKDLYGRLTIVCTDGEASFPDQPPYPVLWVIMPHVSIEKAPKPPWGDVIYIER